MSIFVASFDLDAYTKWTGRETNPATKHGKELFIKNPNYTDEQTATISARGRINQAVAEELAASMGKTVRSVIAKATRMGIYDRKVPVTKSGDPIESKLDLVGEIAALVDGNLDGLEKAPKPALVALRNFVVNG